MEYDTVSGKYAEFIETEVLPRIAKDYNVKFTKDPEGRATMGAAPAGRARSRWHGFIPELYRRVLTYSGTYVNQQSPENPQYAARGVGISRASDSPKRAQAAARLAGSRRE